MTKCFSSKLQDIVNNLLWKLCYLGNFTKQKFLVLIRLL